MDKRFLIKCKSCNWAEKSTGLSTDLEHLKEIKKCKNCGGRQFKCPQCGATLKMYRTKGNTK